MRIEDLEVTFHPIRSRILILIATSKELSGTQIREELQDVPQATLYRHINALVKANIIEVCRENRVRGAVEKIYTLKEMPIDPNEVSNEYIIEVGYKFILSLLGQLASYSKRKDIDVKKDMLTFQTAPMNLSDEEYMELMMEIGHIFQKYIKYEPKEGRRLRSVSTVVIPQGEN